MLHVILPARRPYIVFGIILTFNILMTLLGYFSTPDSDWIVIGGVLLATLGVIWLWIWYHRVELDDDKITLGRFSILKRSLKRSEIDDWYTFMGIRDKRGRTGPFVRLVVEPKPTSGKKPIIIPLKFFSPEDVKVVKKFLSEPKKTTAI